MKRVFPFLKYPNTIRLKPRTFSKLFFSEYSQDKTSRPLIHRGELSGRVFHHVIRGERLDCSLFVLGDRSNRKLRHVLETGAT